MLEGPTIPLGFPAILEEASLMHLLAPLLLVSVFIASWRISNWLSDRLEPPRGARPGSTRARAAGGRSRLARALRRTARTGRTWQERNSMSHEPCALCGMDRAQARGASSDPLEMRAQAQRLRGVLRDLGQGAVHPAELSFKAAELCAMCREAVQGSGAGAKDIGLEERIAGLVQRLDEQAGAAESSAPGWGR